MNQQFNRKGSLHPPLASTAHGLHAGSPKYRDTLVGRISSHHGHAIAGGGQMGFAVRLDGQAPHDVDVGVEAVPSVGIEKLQGGSPKDVDAGINENEVGSLGNSGVIGALTNPEYLD